MIDIKTFENYEIKKLKFKIYKIIEIYKKNRTNWKVGDKMLSSVVTCAQCCIVAR